MSQYIIMHALGSYYIKYIIFLNFQTCVFSLLKYGVYSSTKCTMSGNIKNYVAIRQTCIQKKCALMRLLDVSLLHSLLVRFLSFSLSSHFQPNSPKLTRCVFVVQLFDWRSCLFEGFFQSM